MKSAAERRHLGSPVRQRWDPRSGLKSIQAAERRHSSRGGRANDPLHSMIVRNGNRVEELVSPTIRARRTIHRHVAAPRLTFSCCLIARPSADALGYRDVAAPRLAA
jgi:hypothetical protein